MGYYEQVGANNIKRREELAKLPRYHWRRVDWWHVLIIWGQIAFWASVAWLYWRN